MFCNSGKSSGPVRPPDGHTSSGLEAVVSGWIPSPPWGSDLLSYICLSHFSSTSLLTNNKLSFPPPPPRSHPPFPPQQPYLIVFSPLLKHSHSCLCHPLSLSLCLWSLTLNLPPSICFSSFVGPALFLIKITSGFDLLWSFWSYCGYRLNSKPTTILNQPNTRRLQREGMFFLTMDQNDFFFPPLLSSIIKSSAFVTWRGRPVTHFASQPVNPHNLWIGTWRGL